MTREIQIMNTTFTRTFLEVICGKMPSNNTWDSYVLLNNETVCVGTKTLAVEFVDNVSSGEFFTIDRYRKGTLYLKRYEFPANFCEMQNG